MKPSTKLLIALLLGLLLATLANNVLVNVEYKKMVEAIESKEAKLTH